MEVKLADFGCSVQVSFVLGPGQKVEQIQYLAHSRMHALVWFLNCCLLIAFPADCRRWGRRPAQDVRRHYPVDGTRSDERAALRLEG